MPLM